ncbi:hypothetical protein E2493_16890 [Sphingomonas parva]|uniref:Magnesium transporter MgtE intracellular domain-containing protein n=1 Tax=Sphingomonas parva TaxID=2555898 RepID=A0A4Y8ZNT6_9SPHN|nr:hypothetical protein [Sphingomonas parva]TFI57107.1 hypothetical protein E2493_16890 [Sphingomonas parva]
MSRRPPLLPLLAGMAALAIVANGVAISAPAAPQETRMGVSIKQSVKDRDRAAAERNRALDLREQAARAAEERLKAEMLAKQNAPKAAAAGKAAEEEEGPYDSLARIYQTMKPAKAARVFEQLELDVQVQVAQRMRDRATASILASMSPDAAARLSMAMAGKNAQKALPQPAPRAARPAPAAAPAAGNAR